MNTPVRRPMSSGKRLILQAVFVLSWSSGFIGAKMGAQSAGAFNLLFWRFALVSVCLALYLNTRLATITWGQLRHHAVLGFLSQFLYLSCVYVAIENGLPPGIAAVVAALQPLMTAALSSSSASERSGAWQWLGLIIGFVGVAIVIVGQYSIADNHLSLFMYLLPLVSAFGLSIATIYERAHASVQSTDLMTSLFLQSVFTLCCFAVMVSFTDTFAVPTQANVLVSVIWLTVFSTFIAYLSLWMLLRELPATQVAALVYLEPPVTLAWAAMMFGDAVQASTYAGGLIVVAGLYLVRSKVSPVAAPDAPR